MTDQTAGGHSTPTNAFIIHPRVARLLGGGRSMAEGASTILEFTGSRRRVTIVPGSEKNGDAELSVEVTDGRKSCRIRMRLLIPWGERNTLTQTPKDGQDRDAAMAIPSLEP